jgi:hypothetical protein
MKICGIKAKMSSLAPKLIFIQVRHVYALCRTWDCFWTSQTLFAKRYKDVQKPIPRWAQTTDLNATG